MKKWIFPAALLLGGCTTFSNMENGLNVLMGQPIQVAFDNLGYPSGQMKVGDDTVYGWGRNFTMNMPTTSTAQTFGTVGTTPYSGTTTATSWTPTQYSCDVKIIAGPDGIIKDWQYNGNMGGCEAFAKPLGRLAKSHQP
ncbi:hypothetical protein [Croceicoccus marinus]|nr:hypothetical protein [Croceicoccus marinus]